MKRYRDIIWVVLSVLLWSCSDEDNIIAEKEAIPFDVSTNIQTEIVPFSEDGATQTRANLAGDQFEAKDMIRLRIVAPYSSSTEWGENTWTGGTHDNWYLLEWTAPYSNWRTLGADRGFDLNGDFTVSGASGITTLTQSTPYVFTATTWTEEIHYIVSGTTTSSADKVVSTFSNIFKADQREVADYKSSDVLWAQHFMQTASENIRLCFQHKMSALCIDISAFSGELTGTEEIVLTLENMPDINQQEVVIGNYYAAKIKLEAIAGFGERTRSACDYDDNGKVLGIVVAENSLVKKTFESLPQDGVYTALKGDPTNKVGTENNKFYLIIPPYTVPADVTPTLWLRQGTKRWSAELSLPADRTFKSGVRYSIEMTKPAPATTGTGDNNDGNND